MSDRLVFLCAKGLLMFFLWGTYPEKFADYYDFSVAVSGCSEIALEERKYGFLSQRYLFIYPAFQRICPKKMSF